MTHPQLQDARAAWMSVAPKPLAARVAVISALDFENTSLKSHFGPSGSRSRPDESRVSLFQAGAGPQRASLAARAALQNGAAGLVSWGVAGGLHPALVPGAIVLPVAVHTPTGEMLTTDTRWRENLRSALSQEFAVHEGGLLSVAEVLSTPRDKARAAKESGAVAVDMESAAIGEVAMASGIPFVVLRVILDGAADSLPDVEGLMDQAGNRDSRAVLRLVCKPAQWSRLFVLAGRFRRARAALTRCALHAAPDAFHFPELPSARG